MTGVNDYRWLIMFIITSNNKTPQSRRSHSCLNLLRQWNNWSTAHSGRVWGKTPVQSVLKRSCQSNYCGRGFYPCDVTWSDGLIWERGKDFSKKKKKGFKGITTFINIAYRSGTLTVFLSVLFVLYIYIYIKIWSKYIYIYIYIYIYMTD